MKFSNQKLAWTYYQCLEYAITAHFNYSFIPSHISTQNKDMCHGIVGFNMIKIQS